MKIKTNTVLRIENDGKETHVAKATGFLAQHIQYARRHNTPTEVRVAENAQMKVVYCKNYQIWSTRKENLGKEKRWD
jgi:hypothetical protein